MNKWKPFYDSIVQQYTFVRQILLKNLCLRFVNDKGTHTISVWLDVKEAREYANQIIEECDKIDRINGIRVQDFTMRWQ